MLEIKNLCKEITCANGEKQTILSVKHIEIKQGLQMAIVGPSGSGKTTLLHLIAGLVSPSRGEIFYKQQRIDCLSESKKDQWRAKNIGYIFQRFNLLEALTVQENVYLAGVLAGRKDKKKLQQEVTELLEFVRLHAKANMKPKKLSMGEQQRVAIVRAIINKPSLVLADEPTASLDKKNALRIIDLLQNFCKENNSTLLLSTHDQTIISRFTNCYDLELGRQKEKCIG